VVSEQHWRAVVDDLRGSGDEVVALKEPREVARLLDLARLTAPATGMRLAAEWPQQQGTNLWEALLTSAFAGQAHRRRQASERVARPLEDLMARSTRRSCAQREVRWFTVARPDTWSYLVQIAPPQVASGSAGPGYLHLYPPAAQQVAEQAEACLGCPLPRALLRF